MNHITFIILAIIFPFAYGLCGVVRKYALKKAILDIPSDRSSHQIPTPRGGGLAIVIVFLLLLVLMFFRKIIPLNVFLAFFGGGGLIAFIGLLDDLKIVNLLKPRLVAQLIATLWALYWLGGLPQLNLGFTTLDLGFVGTLLAVFAIVWVTNLYNFMDGIDGLSGTEAVSVSLFAGLMLLLNGSTGLAILCFGLAMACLGFLVWNWPKAKIFMGDVGSGFLGFIFAALAVASENTHATPLLVWAILLGVFLVDATATLFRRVYQKECWYQAHKTHAYQCAVQNGYSHQQVTLAVLVINLGLAILAWLAWQFPSYLLLVFISNFLMILLLHIIVCLKYDPSLIFRHTHYSAAAAKEALKDDKR